MLYSKHKHKKEVSLLNHSIGESLKKSRLESGISVKEISDLLISKGFKASEKTIYSWEAGNSQPSPDALLIMCKAYGVRDVLKTFGYSQTNEGPVTIAAHFDGDDYTDDELEKIREFAEFVKSSRK